MKLRNSPVLRKTLLVLVAVVSTAACIFLYGRSQALSATVSRPGAASTNVQTFAFPARSGNSVFDVVSLPERNYEGEAFLGSSIFSAWDGTATASNYMNFAHTGQNSETSDNFLLQFFNQTQCITDANGKSIPGDPKDEKFTATFTKPNLTGASTTRKTIRAYDHFEITWGSGNFTVTMKRFWRAIDLPKGETPETFSPNDYFIEQPLDSDTPSPQVITKTLTYTGEFAPFSSRIDHGQPYDTENFARPASVKIKNGEVWEVNKDFNFFDISTSAEGQGTKPDDDTCRLNANTVIKEKIEPCGCLNNNDIKACGDETVQFIDLWPPVQFSLSTGTVWQVKDASELQYGISAYGEQFAGEGIIRLDINAYDATNGSKYSISALPLNFKTKPEDSYFSWCFNGKSQQGLVAGGDWITDTRTTLETKDADSSGCCDYVTRIPEVDSNNDGIGDGIDDAWQLRYGFKLTGKKDYLLPANYDADASGSEAVKGLPGDGFVADEFLDAAGERIAVTPGTVNAKTREAYKTGDGVFTAAEEYIWGTDPTQFDTDQDGYPDEADIVGVGQKSVDFVSRLQPRAGLDDTSSELDRYNVKVKTLGRVSQMRTFEDQAGSGDDLPNITRIAEDSKFIFARDPGEMTVSLAASPASPGVYDPITLVASLVMGTRAGGNPVFYWYAKRTPGHGNNPGTGQPAGETTFLEGEGINKVVKTIHDICPECQPGDTLEISLEVDDTLRGDVVSTTTTLEVGDENSLQVFQDCNSDGADEEVGSATYCFRSNEVTKNIPVRVSVAFFNVNPAQFYFQWKLDGVIQTSNCLQPNATSATVPEKCGFGTTQMVFTPQTNRRNYPIELLVYKNDREDVPPAQFNPTPSVEIAHYTSTIASGIPAVTIVFEPASANLDGGYPVGTQVTARAYVEFLDSVPKGQLTADPKVPGTQDGAKALRYVWRDANGQIIKVDELTSIDGSTITVDGSNPGIAEVSVQVTSPDYFSTTDQSVPVPITGASIAYFVSGGVGSSVVSILQARLASLVGFIPAPLLQMIKIAAVVTFAVIVVIGFATVPRFRKPR